MAASGQPEAGGHRDAVGKKNVKACWSFTVAVSLRNIFPSVSFPHCTVCATERPEINPERENEKSRGLQKNSHVVKKYNLIL